MNLIHNISIEKLSFPIMLFGIIFITSISGHAQTYEIVDDLWNEAENARKNGFFLEAAELFERAVVAEQKCNLPRGEYLYHELKNASYNYNQASRLDKALELRLLSLEQCILVFGKEHENYGLEVGWIGWLYKNLAQYDKALTYYLEALENTGNNFGKEDLKYGNCLNNLVILYENIGQYDKALPLSIEAFEITKKNVGKEHPEYVLRLNNLARMYILMGQYEMSLSLYTEALQITERTKGKQHEDYGTLLNNLASSYENIGQYDKALSLYNEALVNTELTKGKEHPEFGSTLSNLALLYQNMGLYDKALPLYFESLEILERTKGKLHPDYGLRLNNLAGLYERMGQYDKAISFQLESIENTKNTLGYSHPEYGIRLNNLVILYRRLGQFDKALPICQEAHEIIEYTLGKDHPDYGISLSNMAGLYEDIGQYDEALQFYQMSLENIEKTLGKDHMNYGIGLNNLALLYQTMEQYDQALPLYIEAQEITKNMLGQHHGQYGIGLNNLALLYQLMGEYDKSLTLTKEALENIENTLGKDHAQYGIAISNMALLYQRMGQFDKALPVNLQALENTYRRINQAFSFMSEKEKEFFIETVKPDFLASQSFFTRHASKDPMIASHAYDIELATKGMILQSGIEVRQSILNSGNSEAIAQYEEWFLSRSLLAKQYSLPIADRRKDIKNLEEKAEQAEAKLSSLSAAFQNEKESNSVRWQQVQQGLKPGEVAIEFASFQYHNDKKWTDSIMYIALLLRKGDAHPTLIPLFEERQLDSLLEKTEGTTESAFVSNLYRSLFDDLAAAVDQKRKGKELYELIWKPLETQLKGAQTVFYTPSGRLHQISFSALPMNKGSLLSDRFHLRQLSSTALIASSDFRESATSIKSAVLFGGVEYNLKADEWTTAAKNVKTDGELLVSRGLPEDMNRGNAWTYLPGSLWEVDSISSLLDQHHVSYQKFQHENALEEVMKQLSGENNPDVLHISTHGFFFPEPENQATTSASFIGEEHQSVYRQSDNPLFRSGLLFAGANQTWKGEKIPDGLEDGILSAYEVSHLSLANTHLVVLSACETGLGDIKGSEGVFGLQRAFKQAGVDYLLMSLWSVPDFETALFMELFYQDLLAEKSIPDAFKDAQNQMKEKYPNDPYMWAAFVLVR